MERKTNPLSEVDATSVRLYRAWPGGLTRERPVFEVRDVHRDPLWSQWGGPRFETPRRSEHWSDHSPGHFAR